MLIGLKSPGKKKLGLKLGRGNTSCDSFMSSLVLLLINIFTGSVPWEEHCPWVVSEFILVNNSWALLIHFSTGSKTITLVVLCFGKEKKKLTKQQSGLRRGLWFELLRVEKWQGGVTVTKISALCPCTHLSEKEGMVKQHSQASAGLNFKYLQQLGSNTQHCQPQTVPMKTPS